jgi:ParB/RepB/Spo0J family partition protein
MTITDPSETVADGDPVELEPELCWLNLADMAPHPDNPRHTVGDLTELARSIRAHGIIEPLVVLPADDHGVYLIVAGRRRHTAGLQAGVTEVPAVVRPMTRVEVIEAGLSENSNRSDLTLSEEVAAIERLMSLEGGLTPSKLCRRIGRSQSWVRARMAVTILPARWRDALDSGELSIAAGEAAASLADLGPDHLDAVCGQLTGRTWQDPARVVAAYRETQRRRDNYREALDRAVATHPVVHSDEHPAPDKARRLGELFDPDGCRVHASEPCHAVVVKATSWGEGVEVFDVCVDPRRHDPQRIAAAKSESDLASDHTPSRPTNRDDSHAKRKARLTRLRHATETFAKTRGGFAQADLTRLALRSVVLEAGRDAVVFAATILGHDQPRDATATDLLDGADTVAALTRVAGAVALGLAENRMYWSASSSQCRDYLDALIATGWTPDEWTAATLTDRPERD